MKIGTRVWYRGKFASQFSLRGTVENTDGVRFGVRLENGNFAWAEASQVCPWNKVPLNAVVQPPRTPPVVSDEERERVSRAFVEGFNAGLRSSESL